MKFTDADRSRAIEHVLGQMANGRSPGKVLAEDRDLPPQDEPDAAPLRLPAYNTWQNWIADDVEGLQARFDMAKQFYAEALREEIVRLRGQINADNYKAIEARIKSIQWEMSKLFPKQYGDRPDVLVVPSMPIAEVDRALERLIAPYIEGEAKRLN